MSPAAPMRNEVAFCQTIAISKTTTKAFNDIYKAYFSTLPKEKYAEIVTVKSAHIDGTMDAQEREGKVVWLKSADTKKNECYILNNIRCLSERVDVPSLDTVMFFQR